MPPPLGKGVGPLHHAPPRKGHHPPLRDRAALLKGQDAAHQAVDPIRDKAAQGVLHGPHRGVVGRVHHAARHRPERIPRTAASRRTPPRRTRAASRPRSRGSSPEPRARYTASSPASPRSSDWKASRHARRPRQAHLQLGDLRLQRRHASFRLGHRRLSFVVTSGNRAASASSRSRPIGAAPSPSPSIISEFPRASAQPPPKEHRGGQAPDPPFLQPRPHQRGPVEARAHSGTPERQPRSSRAPPVHPPPPPAARPRSRPTERSGRSPSHPPAPQPPRKTSHQDVPRPQGVALEPRTRSARLSALQPPPPARPARPASAWHAARSPSTTSTNLARPGVSRPQPSLRSPWKTSASGRGHRHLVGRLAVMRAGVFDARDLERAPRRCRNPGSPPWNPGVAPSKKICRARSSVAGIPEDAPSPRSPPISRPRPPAGSRQPPADLKARHIHLFRVEAQPRGPQPRQRLEHAIPRPCRPSPKGPCRSAPPFPNSNIVSQLPDDAHRVLIHAGAKPQLDLPPASDPAGAPPAGTRGSPAAPATGSTPPRPTRPRSRRPGPSPPPKPAPSLTTVTGNRCNRTPPAVPSENIAHPLGPQRHVKRRNRTGRKRVMDRARPERRVGHRRYPRVSAAKTASCRAAALP